MSGRISARYLTAAAAIVAAFLALTTPAAAADPVTLVQNGEAALPIVAGSVDEPVTQLRQYIHRVSGAELPAGESKAGAKAVYVGLVSDFENVPDRPSDLGPEGFIIRSQGGSLYLLAETPLGLQHAVTTFLHTLGHRQFFPGDVWEVAPARPTIKSTWDQRQSPTFRSQRRLWYGFGAYGQTREDLEAWNIRNRMGGPEPVSIGHTWYGIDPETDLAAHPEWFAEVERDGERVRVRNKPCYSHPQVVQKMIDYALSAAENGATSVTLSPPDGLNYCECELCQSVFQGGEPTRAHGTMFATRPDGVQVNITSETLFAAVNKVAQAVAEEYPDVVIGCYAYSAYSHPTSFDLHPSIYIQTTTAYRRTPLTLEEQLSQWGSKAKQVGIREYWSVYQWDWDNPDPGKMRPDRLEKDLKFFVDNNVIAMNGESSNNWGPRGLGYYVASQLLWDIDADTTALVRDFYQSAFGPAAPAMERYYARWYGPSAVIGIDPQAAAIAGVTAPGDAVDDSDELGASGAAFGAKDLPATMRTLAAAMADLDDAVRLTDGYPEHRARVDHLRMYIAYLYLRTKVWQAVAANDEPAIVAAVRDETIFGSKLTYTNMIHTRPLIGKAFHRRFKGQMLLLENIEEAQSGGAWRKVRDVPTAAELDELWNKAKADVAAAGDAA